MKSNPEARDLLPRIARGEAYFCIGMQPDSGSDLASIRSRATETPEGWRLNGTKIWTSGAHGAHYMIALMRTDGTREVRHAGLSQFMIDMQAARQQGLEVRPIRNMLGDAEFNEVHFDNLLVPHDALLGERGSGWAQVGAELALERSGPERFLSSIQLLIELIDLADPGDPRHADFIGRALGDVAPDVARSGRDAVPRREV